MQREVLPQAPRELNPEIPPELEQIILRVLSKEPAARYRTADQLGRVLVTYQQDMKRTKQEPPLITTGTHSSAAATQPFESPTPTEGIQKKSNPLDLDWITILLALLALNAVGGLVPFFLWVFFVYNPPFR